MDKKEIKKLKKQIKDLKAEKLRLSPGSEGRIELHRKIKELKNLLIEQKEVNKKVQELKNEKTPIIEEILKYDKLAKRIGQNLYKFSQEELEKHLKKIKNDKY